MRENANRYIAGVDILRFIFRASTDPAAKEQFFLERFTCFQLGLCCP
jgi:hypothetical protein